MRMGQREGDDVGLLSRGLALKASLFQVQCEAAGGFQADKHTRCPGKYIRTPKSHSLISSSAIPHPQTEHDNGANARLLQQIFFLCH